MTGEEYGAPFVGQRSEERAKIPYAYRVKSHSWFVNDQEIGILNETRSDTKALPHPT